MQKRYGLEKVLSGEGVLPTPRPIFTPDRADFSCGEFAPCSLRKTLPAFQVKLRLPEGALGLTMMRWEDL